MIARRAMPMIRVLGLLILLCALSASGAEKLPSYKGIAKETSVVGLSSGGFMAVQYEVAFSGSIKGAGIVAGGPYYCAAGNMLNAGICMGQVPYMAPIASFMVAAAETFEATGRIDALSNLRSHRIYVFSGTNDEIVKQPAVDALVSFYRQLLVPDDALLYVNTLPAGHAIITPDFGNDCSSNSAPSINHCTLNGAPYDQAGAILQHIYGKLRPPVKETHGRIINFDQKEFRSGAAQMADEGFVYVPQNCAARTTCRLVIAFHGCAQSASVVGDKFYAHAGYNRWADSNSLIVLYPQVNTSVFNQQGCWDWFGYTGASYATRSGPQLVAVKAMVDRLLGGP
jgi:poly(3-hydroxybutyrate) depolymerase